MVPIQCHISYTFNFMYYYNKHLKRIVPSQDISTFNAAFATFVRATCGMQHVVLLFLTIVGRDTDAAVVVVASTATAALLQCASN